jgi:hypothetical protein
MVHIVRASADDWVRVREVRLRALEDAPSAFGSTYEEEREQPGSFWRDRLAGRDAATFLTVDGDRRVGLVSVFFEDVGLAHLVSMWVSPDARRQGDRFTGGTQPLPSDPSLEELQMRRPVVLP